MKITLDYHTHTQHSDGSGTVEENVLAAIRLGFTEIAVSDHSVRHAVNGVRDIERYLGDIGKAKAQYKGTIEVKAALECNLLNLDGELDVPKGYEKCFDLLLFGFHKAALYKGFVSALRFLLPKSDDLQSVERNTKAYLYAMQNNPVAVITHIGYGLPVDKLKISAEAAKRGVLLEINNKHPEFTVSELKACRETGVQFILGSDAHSPESVGCVEHAMRKVVEADIGADRIFNAKEGL